ncbi:hypothetical protein CERSUDRAFT_159355 [Gelatoporia subvermispora B]|uniref:Uncharacterized protein n=1 Tax=Ceriporiopsis subvermispora (strain B) TaxID=914234 RepID=M2QPA7_CERS8|nr:hypothetical protein CERSUDRAFT_159355 [Gelatoporia subvermispora B]
MPTAVTTATTSPATVIALKGTQATSAATSKSATCTLRSLYPRAAKAFLQRNVALTHSLLSSAFALLHPPASAAPDPLAPQRTKWDILRITFEITLYASPPPSQNPEELPVPLRANLMLSPEPFIATIYSRSLQLFTPSAPPQKPSSAFLPAQILVTLVLASLKLECTEVGRNMIEDWLAKHGQEETLDAPDGYAKVLELYCLHVLPRLEQWEYAEDFLQYERDLPPEVRQNIISSLRKLRAQSSTAHRSMILPPVTPTIIEPSPSSSRAPSPSPSTSSMSSSSSEHTATPRTPHPGASKGKGKGRAPPLLGSMTSSISSGSGSASSQSISSTATSRTVTPSRQSSKQRAANGNARQRRTPERRRSSPHAGGEISPLPIPPRAPPAEMPLTARAPSTLLLLRQSFEGWLRSVPGARFTAFLIFAVVVPLLSFAFRVRRRRLTPGGAAVPGSTAAEVRRRLRASGATGTGGIVSRLWQETLRAVSDTVRMGGRGLV